VNLWHTAEPVRPRCTPLWAVQYPGWALAYIAIPA